MPNIKELAAVVRQGAACKDMPTELFYPVGDTRAWTTQNEAAPALAICAECPVKEQCLELGLANREQGVWGGQLLTHYGRRKSVA